MSQTLSSSPVDSGSDHAASAGSNPGCLDHVVQDCRASRNRSPLPEYPSEKKWVRGRKGSTNTHAPGDGKEPRDERWDESQLGYQQMEEAVLRCDEGLSAAENGKLSGSRTPDPFVLTSVPGRDGESLCVIYRVHSARRFIMECALALACRRLLRTPCPLQ